MEDWVMDETQPAGAIVQRSFAERRSVQRVVWIAGALLTLLWVLGGGADGRLMAFATIVAVSVFSAVNWRCPACGSFLGRPRGLLEYFRLGVSQCPRCSIRLAKEDAADQPPARPRLGRRLNVGALLLVLVVASIWGLAQMQLIHRHGEIPEDRLYIALAVSGILWLGSIALAGRWWQTHPARVWLVPPAWCLLYTSVLVAVCPFCLWASR
jgi:hypothetical protein